MGRIIAVANQKGGVGKSTTAINLSACLAEKGKKVLAIDIDPQGNTTSGLGVDKNGVENTLYELLLGEADIKKTVIKDVVENLDLIPSSMKLAGIEIEFVDKQHSDPTFSKGSQLKRVLYEIRDNYDYILIDCPPSLGVLTVNALTASDSVLIPVQCEYFALEGIMQLLNTITQARKNLNPKLEIEGVVLTMLDSRTNLGLEVVENVRGFFRERVYDTIIPRLIRLTEAPSHGKPIANYDPTSRGTEAYINLAKEVIARNE